MPLPTEITISAALGVKLVLSPGARYPKRAFTHDQAFAYLKPAKDDAILMAKLRSSVPFPNVKTDDELLDMLATGITNGEFALIVEGANKGTCTVDKQRFFDWVSDDLRQMARDLDTTHRILLTLAVKEGGWRKVDLDHNQPLNNPFGMNLIKHRQAAGNIKYGTLQEAIVAWKRLHGEAVRGIKDPNKFVDVLLARGYNTVNSQYADVFLDDYKWVGKAMESCDIK